jgi:hypothetical protein
VNSRSASWARTRSPSKASHLPCSPPAAPTASTYIAQGWKVTDPQALADVGDVPDHETLIEIPEDVLEMYARRYLEEGGTL